jgi:hypothetical protein
MARRPNAIRQRISLDGGDEVKQALRELGAAGKAAFKAIETAAGKDIAGQFTKNIASIKRDLRPLGRAFGDLGSSARRMGRNLSLAFVGIGAAAAGVVAFTRNATEAADAVGKAAQGVGLAVDEFQRLQFAAEQSGIAEGDFVTGLTRLNQSIGRAASGNKAAAERFKQLGVRVRDARGQMRPTEAIVRDLADAFQRLPEGAQKAAIGAELFGRSVARWLPLLNEGAAGIAALGDEFDTTIGGFTEAQIKLATEVNDAFAAMGRAATRVRHQIGLAFAPSVLRGIHALQDIIARNRAAIIGFAEDIAARVEPVIADLFNTFAGNDAEVINRAFLDWRESILAFGRDVKEVATGVVLPAWQLLLDAADGVAGAINKVFGTDVTAQQVLLVGAIAKVTGAFTVLAATARLALAAIVFFAKHPVIAAILVTAGHFVTLANRQTMAEQAAKEHKQALDDLDAAMAAVGTSSSKARDNLRAEAQASLDAAIAKRELLEAAREEIALSLAIKKIDTLGLSGSKNEDLLIANAMDEARAAVDALLPVQDKLIAGLRARAHELSKADRETRTLTESTKESGRAIGDAGRELSKFPGPEAHIRSVSGPFNAARDAAEKLKEESKKSGDEAERSGKRTEDALGGIQAKVVTVDKAWLAARDAAVQAGRDTSSATNAAAASAGHLVEEAAKVAPALTGAGTAASGALEPVGAAVEATRASIQAAKGDLEAFAFAATEVPQSFTGIETQAAQTAQSLPSLFATAAGAIAAAFAAAFARIRSDLAGLTSAVTAAIARMTAELARLRAAIASAKAAASSGGGGGGGGFSKGGQVFGAGTGTSDSIAVRLSHGEFVIRAAAVEHFGPAFFAALNSLRVPLDDLLRGFNVGGIVDGFDRSMRSLSPAQSFATGGLALATAPSSGAGSGPTTRIDLHLAGRAFPVIADEVVAGALVRVARRQSNSRAGRAQEWVR